MISDASINEREMVAEYFASQGLEMCGKSVPNLSKDKTACSRKEFGRAFQYPDSDIYGRVYTQ